MDISTHPAQSRKTKVSFDIDSSLLSEIKQLCFVRGEKVSDFFRNASVEYFRKQKYEITIFVSSQEHGVVRVSFGHDTLQNIDFFEASEDMRINVGAINEGILVLSADEISKKEEPFTTLSALADISGKVRFFTRTNYLPIVNKKR